MRSEGPSLELDWEVAVFRGLRSLLRSLVRKRRRPAPDDGRSARLAGSERRLALLAQVVRGVPVRVQRSAGAGGVVGDTLFLPAEIGVGPTPEDNARIYVVRTAIGAALHRLGPPARLPSGALDRVTLELARVEDALAWLRQDFAAFDEAYAAAARHVLAARPSPASLAGEAAEVEALRRAALVRGAGADVEPPAVKRRARRDSAPVLLWGELACPDVALDTPGSFSDAVPPSRGATQIDAPPVEHVTLVKLDAKEIEDAVLVHSFEKVDTADEYHGGGRNLDGSDELADHAEALDEVALGKVVRSPDPVHAVLRAEVGLGSVVGDVETIAPGERGVSYDEWDARARGYRPAWCTVYPTSGLRSDAAWARAASAKHRRLIRDLTRAIEARRSRLAPQRACPDGEGIDLDAMVRHLAARGAFEAGSPRLYVRRARQKRDVATTVLLDVSLSSDAWVDDRRVLDVSREGALVLGEVAEALGDSLQILSFASHTRNRCRVWEVRGWDTPWAVGRARLGGLTPQGYTRIGPALRHATRSLAEHPARHRLLLLLSDGKPTDYDRYEGRHGIADVRQAVREADRLGVSVHGLTIDRHASDYLPAMLGPGRWHILRDVAALPRALVAAYAGLAG